MFQIVYISTARALITQEVCNDVLRISRANNRRAGISGLLVAGQQRFLQALEGPTDAVRATFARIVDDPRHFACVVLSERHIDSRQFGDWAMGFIAGEPGAVASETLPSIVEALVAPLEDANMRAQFMGFADLQSRAA